MNGEEFIQTLKMKIDEKGANWTAARTTVSELSSNEKENRLGLLPTEEQLAQITKLGLDTELESRSFGEYKPQIYKAEGLPNSIDWRTKDGANWMTPVKDQGNCGSCVACGTIATLEALLKIRCYNDAEKDIDLSEAHLLWCGGGSCKGWQMDKACDYLKKNGVPDEACFPYKPKRMSCKNTCPDWKNRVDNTVIIDWANTKDVGTMKKNLTENGPQISGMAVYEDFFSYTAGVYTHVTGDLAGYHCICVVGYDDNEGCWICKNSWGTGWGEEGFFKIAYGECGIDDSFGMWNMELPKEEFIQTLKMKIEEKGANWTAARTTVSELSSSEKENRLGLLPTEEQLAQITKLGLDTELESRSFGKYKPQIYKAEGLPNSIDWRTTDGANWMASVKDQGDCGSCVAFGTIATLEALLKIRYYNDAEKDIDLSEAHLLWCGGGSCKGWQMDKACDYLKKNGVPDEACFPYQPKPMSCTNTCPDWKNRVDNTVIIDWANTKDVGTMKKNLTENGPQISGIAVYNDFFNYKTGVYKHVTGDLAGYHCICVVGYDDNEGCWICKNSWGTGWGEEGFFKMAYGECGLEDAFGMWNMEIQEPPSNNEGYADQVSIDYFFESSTLVLHAYADGKWRHKQLNSADLTGIATLAMQASKVFVGWKEDQLTFIRYFK